MIPKGRKSSTCHVIRVRLHLVSAWSVVRQMSQKFFLTAHLTVFLTLGNYA